MLRCLELARKGISGAAPNPLVGAVLVHEGRIIGEGWHQQYGGVHAEVNCLASVLETDRELIPDSVLYVSLEPCAHYGKTPPCTDLIIRHKIQRVVVGCADPFEAVNGKGIQRLKDAGVVVTENVLEVQCREINKRFFCMNLKKRPYVILKWAQTEDGYTGTGNEHRLMISNAITQRRVHQWRTEEQAILVGFNTAKLDNPKLDNRFWPGRMPVRIVIDPQLQLTKNLHLLIDGNKTIVFNTKKSAVEDEVHFIRVDDTETASILNELYELEIQSVLVEGGTHTLQAFIDSGLWDEARVITAMGVTAGAGTAVPQLTVHRPQKEEWILNDRIGYYFN